MTVLAILLAASTANSPYVRADQLRDEASSWRSGDEVPSEFLASPNEDGSASRLVDCGVGSVFCPDLQVVKGLRNEALLEELVFEPRVTTRVFRASLRRLVETVGPSGVAAALEKRGATRAEHETLRSLLRAPLAHAHVASIDLSELAEPQALDALRGMALLLASGEGWQVAYAETAEKLPDLERRKLEPQVPTSLLRNEYRGWVSMSGRSLSSLEFHRDIPRAVFAIPFENGDGPKVQVVGSRAYLVWSSEYHVPSA